MDGLLLIDKQKGWTSFDVVAKVRGIIRAQTGVKKVKVGHCGTLDPLATGLLLIVVGAYCKRAQEFSGLDKTYRATITLGVTSTTGDEEGEKIKQSFTHTPTETEVTQVLSAFSGVITQTPPVYSALKINGQRAYALARAGKAVKPEPRQVTIHTSKLIDYDFPTLEIETRVSAGTYIRTLAEDIGVSLCTGAYLSDLRRICIDDFSVESAVTVEAVEADITKHLQQM